ncbi:CotO family spore coat protein [Bacillus pseudomycoides]|uniref:CotO family spore coat protein n=2 Tax=Bacillus cereus group TaxID=86661 RepID=UPI000BEF2FAB|nr:CotO family spore coat protein [Bacillus pseudomycoides]PEK72368.1 hypothetical protein CN590_04140 [Bacillus pseudomycoides]PEL24741.1 hypothetical protein CN608_17615 [Bacillus pseudomycoides]PGE86459.1 hypothetical protein COM55_08415 [Bacillus pseudomycoides]
MGKEKKTSSEQQPRLYIAQSKRSQLVGGMQKVFIVKQNSIEQHQLDLNQENKSETLPNVPSSEMESEETEEEVEEKPFSSEEESISVDNEEETEEEVEEKPFSAEKESVSVDNEMEIEKEVEGKGKGKKAFTQMTNIEKINYVLNRPHYIPNIQCAVQTRQEVYVGYIVSFEKEVLKLKSSTYFNFVTIKLAEIETIQMKGLT